MDDIIKNRKGEWITLKIALDELNITESEIRNKKNKIRRNYIILESGEVEIVNIDDIKRVMSLRDIKREHFDHLNGKLIGVSEAAEKYGVHQGTLSRWMNKGVFEIVQEVKRYKLVDEGDMAYFIALGLAQDMRPGKRTHFPKLEKRK